MVNKNFGGIFRDDAWQNVKRLRDAISCVEGVDDIEMWAGEYHNYLQTASTNKAPYRDYKTIVYTAFGNLSGYIRCCAAGTTEDPFSAYDIVISLYPEMNNEVKQGKMKTTITESQLKNIIKESVKRVLKESAPLSISPTLKELYLNIDTAKLYLDLFLKESPRGYEFKNDERYIRLGNLLDEALNIAKELNS